MITERKGFTPGHGRTPGAINKTTKERTKLFREKLDANNLLFILVDEILADIKSGNVRFSDKIKALSTIAPYLVQTVNMDQIAEQIAAISSREDAEKVAADIAGQLRLVR
ncbi:hypothetical protein MLN87_07420 [Escherichia coli]|nr:hypothetical protein [Escherichia coli]MCN8204093.1 hypothetical protein [Escherichia coli]HAI3384515.1 hypothetical protein [Escherichia coli]HAL0004653.1 hypothetical protein [Escherichia coli]HAP1523995.1 hypothetical protein [Escherichia coli]